MHRLAALLMLLLSLTPTMAMMDDEPDDDDDWGYSGDFGYVGYIADSDTVCIMDEAGQTYNVHLGVFEFPDKAPRGYC